MWPPTSIVGPKHTHQAEKNKTKNKSVIILEHIFMSISQTL